MKGIKSKVFLLLFSLIIFWSSHMSAQVKISPQIKVKADPIVLTSLYRVHQNTPQIKIRNRWIPLMAKEFMDVEPIQKTREYFRMEAQKFWNQSQNKFPSLKTEDLKKNGMKDSEIAQRMNHRHRMTLIRDQGRRGTCVAFASMAGLEAFDKIPNNLSEQYAYYILKKGLNIESTFCVDGLVTWQAADYLARSYVCEEKFWEYNPEKEDRMGRDCVDYLIQTPMPDDAKRRARFGVNEYHLIFDDGKEGVNSIKNIEFLKRLLFGKYNIVLGTYVAGTDWEEGEDLIRIQYSVYDSPITSTSGHALLICGFNDTGNYFIVKNSWGEEWGHNGYAYIGFAYIHEYAKYGFVIKSVRTQE